MKLKVDWWGDYHLQKKKDGITNGISDTKQENWCHKPSNSLKLINYLFTSRDKNICN